MPPIVSQIAKPARIGPLRRLAGDRHDPGHRLELAVEGGRRPLRPGVAEAGDGAVDQPRVEPRERLVAEPQPVHHAGPEVLPHHVGASPTSRLTISTASGLRRSSVMLRLLPFTARKPGGILRSAHSDATGWAARLVAVARLDLDDVGAQERELVGAVRPGEVAGEVEDADAGERLAHLRSALGSR